MKELSGAVVPVTAAQVPPLSLLKPKGEPLPPIIIRELPGERRLPNPENPVAFRKTQV